MIRCGLTFYKCPSCDTIKICIDQLFKSEMTVSGLVPGVNAWAVSLLRYSAAFVS